MVARRKMGPLESSTVVDSSARPQEELSLDGTRKQKIQNGIKRRLPPISITSKYVFLNLRFIFRCFAFVGTAAIIGLQTVEIFSPHTDEFNGFKETFHYGGLECKTHRNSVNHRHHPLYIYLKMLSLTFAVWLEMKVSILFLPLFHGYWLYTRQEKLLPLRTVVILIGLFNTFPLVILAVDECVPGAPYFLAISIGVFICLLLDRILIRDRDYYKLDVQDDMPLLTSRQWLGRYERPAQQTKTPTEFCSGPAAVKQEPSNNFVPSSMPGESAFESSTPQVSTEPNKKSNTSTNVTTSIEPIPKMVTVNNQTASAEPVALTFLRKKPAENKEKINVVSLEPNKSPKTTTTTHSVDQAAKPTTEESIELTAPCDDPWNDMTKMTTTTGSVEPDKVTKTPTTQSQRKSNSNKTTDPTQKEKLSAPTVISQEQCLTHDETAPQEITTRDVSKKSKKSSVCTPPDSAQPS